MTIYLADTSLPSLNLSAVTKSMEMTTRTATLSLDAHGTMGFKMHRTLQHELSSKLKKKKQKNKQTNEKAKQKRTIKQQKRKQVKRLPGRRIKRKIERNKTKNAKQTRMYIKTKLQKKRLTKGEADTRYWLNQKCLLSCISKTQSNEKPNKPNLYKSVYICICIYASTEHRKIKRRKEWLQSKSPVQKRNERTLIPLGKVFALKLFFSESKRKISPEMRRRQGR